MSPMKKDDQVNAVALSMQTVMGMLNQFYDAMVGRGQHEVVLLVGAGDVVQFSANTRRDRSVLMLQDLLARWSIGMPDTLPGEQTPGDTRAFEYLLNEFEKAIRNGHDHIAARGEVVAYVGRLIAAGNRSKGNPA